MIHFKQKKKSVLKKGLGEKITCLLATWHELVRSSLCWLLPKQHKLLGLIYKSQKVDSGLKAGLCQILFSMYEMHHPGYFL